VQILNINPAAAAAAAEEETSSYAVCPSSQQQRFLLLARFSPNFDLKNMISTYTRKLFTGKKKHTQIHQIQMASFLMINSSR
jgi:hypothetical protein